MNVLEPELLEHPDAQRVLLAMAGPDDPAAPPIRTFARDLGMPVERARRILLALQQQGLVAYGAGPLMPPASRGIHTYRLTANGERLQSQMENGRG